MKKITFASLLLATGLMASVFGQVKPAISNNHVTSISAASGASVSSATRVRVLGKGIPEAKTLSSMAVSNSSIAAALSQVYRVGVGDVLDIRISQNTSRQSTLFTVLEGGLVDYPLAGDPLPVAGLTTAEVGERLRQSIRFFNRPEVAVKVRDYASHSVTINGFVAAPGAKTLRREAVPLYVVLSEALPLPEAAQATIIRKDRAPVVLNLADTVATGTLVVSGDVIRISAEPVVATEFFFAGGEINSPGQKLFHSDLTLTQAILASGGPGRNAGAVVRLSRQGSDGRLVTTEYNLSNIQTGKAPDPTLMNGDRIELGSAR